MKQWGIGYSLVIMGDAVLGILFQFSLYGYVVIGAVGCILVPVWVRIQKRQQQMRCHYDEMTVYMELLLCSFKRVGHLKLALQDCQFVFPMESKMGKVIRKAIYILESGEGSEDGRIAESALRQISDNYNCRRITLLHHFLCRADCLGGDVEEALDILLADFEMWKRRLVLYWKTRRWIGCECMVSVVLALLLCSVSRMLIPANFLCEMRNSTIYQVTTVVVICALALVLTVIRILVGQSQMEGKRERKTVKEVEHQFPYWLLAVTIYLKQDSLYHALQQSRDEVSGRFQKEVDHLIQAVYEQPTALEPYVEFFHDIPLPELHTGMKLLYAVNANGYQDTKKQIQFLVEQCHVMMDRQEKQYFRMKLAGFRMLRQVPMMIAGGKAIIDIVTFFILLGRQTQFWNGG